MDEPRDTELGRELERFAEPEHGPEYWDGLRRQVAQASAEARSPTVGRRLRAAFAPRRVRVAAAAAALAAVALIVVLVGLPGTRGPQPVSAAQVLDNALAAYATLQTWQADGEFRGFDPDLWEQYHAYATRQAHVIWAADGSRYENYGPLTVAGRRLMDRSLTAYDATTAIEVGYDGSERTWGRATDVPFGPPDAGTVPLVDVNLVIRALAAAETLQLGETVIDGRPAWTVSCTREQMANLPPSGEDSPLYTVTVDKQTWMLLGVTKEEAGRVTASAQWRNVRVNDPLPDDAFTIEPPPGAHVEQGDGGFRRLSLDEAAAAPGVTPLVPAAMPGGYALAEVAVADRSVLSREIADADVTFTTRHVFALGYRRGFDAVTVSTRIVEDAGYTAEIDLCDEFDQPWSRRARTEVTLSSGAFAGARARILVASTTSAPHLWAVKDGVLLTIAGTASAGELLAIAESLRVSPGPASSPAAE